jgi:hypothetical protein
MHERERPGDTTAADAKTLDFSPLSEFSVGTTIPSRGYFAILRLYGPTETAIEKTWKPGDIEKVP